MVNVWIKPLSDGSFAVALVNRDPAVAHSVQLNLNGGTDGDFYSGPATNIAKVRDIGRLKDLGTFHSHFNSTVPPMDGRLLRFAFGSTGERQEL